MIEFGSLLSLTGRYQQGAVGLNSEGDVTNDSAYDAISGMRGRIGITGTPLSEPIASVTAASIESAAKIAQALGFFVESQPGGGGDFARLRIWRCPNISRGYDRYDHGLSVATEEHDRSVVLAR